MSDEITMLYVGGIKIGLVGLSDIFKELKSSDINKEKEIKSYLLEKVKSQNYIPSFKEKEYALAVFREYKKSIGLPLEVLEEEISEIIIRVLGPGCYACEKLEQDVKVILAELNIAANVEHVRDINEIASYGMIGTPSLVINKEVVLSGRTLPVNQLKKLIENKLVSTR